MLRKEISDVTSAHLALRNTGLQFQHMFDQAAVGVARVAPDGRFLVANSALYRMLGYSRSDLLRKTTQEITHPDDRARDAALLKTILRGNETSYKTNKRYLCRSGWPLWVTETSSAVEDSAGSMLYRVALIQINERKQAAEHFRLAVEAAASAMVMLNQKGRIILINSWTEKLFGYAREELLGKPISILLAKPSRRNLCHSRDLLNHLESQPPGATWDLHGRCKNGTCFPARLALHPVHTLKGTWILSSIEDTTMRTRPQDNLRQTRVTVPILRIPSFISDAKRTVSSTRIGSPQTG